MRSFTVVAIGASAGGLEAFSALLKHLPSDTGMAFIYVQHLDPNHKSSLPSILTKVTKMKVEEIDDMELMKPDHVYVIPHNKGIKVTDGHIKLIPRSKGGKAISIDVLFSSLAATHKENVIGVVLSGNAHDGTIGLRSIKDAGGLTFAQDGSAQAGSMPGSAIAAGVVDFVLAPREIALELVRNSKRSTMKQTVRHNRKADVAKEPGEEMKTIFGMLHKEKGVDFNSYKIATIRRRLDHRLMQSKTQSIKEYVKLLSSDSNEIDLLCKDLLINVTGFFRDTATFRYLRNTFLPKLLKSKKRSEGIRIWVPACSTGQEVYSIAMLLTELQDNKTQKIPVKIFATDLSEHAIQEARIGEYSAADLAPVPKKSVKRFFSRSGANYMVSKQLREMCVFAPHNILSDPPFFRIDLISCRNLLIYFDTEAQKKALATMNFALNDGGFLLLGKSETTGTASKLFTQVNSKFKIYARKKNTGIRKMPQLEHRVSGTTAYDKTLKTIPRRIAPVDSAILDKAIDTALLSRYMPACAIINKEMEILQFRGLSSLYLTHPSGGKASLNILKMMRPEFAVELRSAIKQCIQTSQYVSKSDIEIKIDSTLRKMTVEVCPLKIEWSEPLLLVVFTLQELVAEAIEGKNKNGGTAKKDQRIKTLTEALNNARAEIDSVIESQETAYEELQGANEEIVSTNEEFQTLNEELETSKEEVEATNEELASTNQELKTHNDLLSESYDYSEAIIATIHEPMIILNGDLVVRSANASFYEKFLVKKEETEGRSVFQLGNKQWDIPRLHILLEDILAKNKGFQDFEVTHTFPVIGEKIMLLNAHRIIQKAHREQLILLAIADHTEPRALAVKLKEKENEMFKERLALEKKALKKSEEGEGRYRNLIQSLPVAIYTCDKDGYVQLYNKTAVELWGRKPQIGKDRWCSSDKIFSIDGSPISPDTCPMAIAIKEERSVKGEEIIVERPDGTRSHIIPNPQPIFDESGKFTGAINTIIDITLQKIIEKELTEAKVFAELATGFAEEAKAKAESATDTAENSTRIAEDAVKAKQQFLSNMSHEIRTPMNAIIGFTKVVLKTELSAKQKEYLNAIKMSGDALIVLINDILDLAKVDAGKMTFEQIPFKMAASLAAMLHVFETKIQEKNLDLVKEYDNRIPEVLLGDPVRLHQIILNLVSNAVKFTTQGKITVSVRMLKEDEKKVTLEFAVADTGIGVSEDKIANIFENFQQATSGTARLFGGTGLGLAIVKQLVEPQGGTITVKSKVNEGSVFSFTLDFQKTIEAAELKPALLALNPKMKNIKVLVVEDILLNQLLMKTLLDDFGFERDIAANGKIAVEKLKKGSYDVVLMDLQMPEMNGFEATEYIRNTLKSSIPIIALTADVTTVDLEKCKAVGMNDYLSKPVDERVLYTKIMSLVKIPDAKEPIAPEKKTGSKGTPLKFINLDYLAKRTKSDPKMMKEMISLYLEQTPPLITAMKQGLKDKDWKTLHSAVHKMIPSFSIMGIPPEFEAMARQLQEYTGTEQHIDKIPALVSELDTVCSKACKELEEEFSTIKSIEL